MSLTERYRNLRNRLCEYKADLDDVLSQLDYIQKEAMEGIKQQKVSVKDGVMDVIELYPELYRKAAMDKFSVLKYLDEQLALADDDNDAEPGLTINISLAEVVD